MKPLDVEFVRYGKLKHIKFLVNRVQMRKEHTHNEFEIFLVLDGFGSAKIKNRIYEINQGDIFLINSSEIHSYFNSRVGSSSTSQGKNAPLFLFAQISNHCFREYFPQIRTTTFTSCNLRDYLSDEEAKKMTRLLISSASAYFNEPAFYQYNVLRDVAEILRLCYLKVPHVTISEAQKNSIKAKTARVNRIISYIDANFETQIRLQDLAEQENLSPTHFSHLFTSLFHVTFQEYVNIKRMEQCIRLMPNKEKTLLEISYESGFSDPKYMNKMFLRHFGCTPKEYRQKNSVEINDENQGSNDFENIYNTADSIATLDKYKSTHKDVFEK